VSPGDSTSPQPAPQDNNGGAPQNNGGAPPQNNGAGAPTPNPDLSPPKVKINNPAPMAQMKPSFVVRAVVNDDVGVAKAELFVDGKLMATRSAAPYDFPVTLQVGKHNIRIVGHDKATKKAAAMVTITVVSTTPNKQPPSQAPAPQATPQAPGAGTGGYGTQCTVGSNCQSGICASDLTLNKQYCTQTCVPGSMGCPVGSSCYPTSGGNHVCAPDLSNNIGSGTDYGQGSGARPVGGMGCAVAPGAPPPLALLLALGALVLGLALGRS
jgi:hypothetical protein